MYRAWNEKEKASIVKNSVFALKMIFKIDKGLPLGYLMAIVSEKIFSLFFQNVLFLKILLNAIDGNKDFRIYVKYLVFRIEDRKYAIELNHVNGTEQNYSIIPFPDAPFGVQGIINLRGKLVPVYSLRQRFGMDTNITNPGKSALIARTSGIMIAYEVDCVEFIEEVDSTEIREMPKMASNDETAFMNKILHVKNQIVVVVDVNKVLSAEAIEQLEKMIEERTAADKKAEEEKRAAELVAKEAEMAEKADADETTEDSDN